jgi:hypothetical protein
MKIRILFILFAACFCKEMLHGQAHTFLLGGGLTAEALIDRAYSPLIYSGIGYNGTIGYIRKTERKETHWVLLFGSGSTSNTFNRSIKTTAIRLHNYTFYNRDNPESRLSWGWSNMNSFHTRLIDDFSNFNGRTDFLTSFGPAIKYQTPFELKESKFSFQMIAQMQLIGFYVPSAYVASLPGGFGYEKNNFIRSILRSAYLFYPGSGWNASIFPKINWHLSSGNSLALNYLVEFTQLNKAQVHKRITGTWFLSFSTTL